MNWHTCPPKQLKLHPASKISCPQTHAHVNRVPKERRCTLEQFITHSVSRFVRFLNRSTGTEAKPMWFRPLQTCSKTDLESMHCVKSAPKLFEIATICLKTQTACSVWRLVFQVFSMHIFFSVEQLLWDQMFHPLLTNWLCLLNVKKLTCLFQLFSQIQTWEFLKYLTPSLGLS